MRSALSCVPSPSSRVERVWLVVFAAADCCHQGLGHLGGGGVVVLAVAD